MSDQQKGKKGGSLVIIVLSIIAVAAIVLAIIGFTGKATLSTQVDELTAKSETLSTQIAEYKQQKQAADDAAAQAAAEAAEVEAAKAAAEAEAAAKAEAEAAAKAEAEAAAKAEAEAAAKAAAEAEAAAKAAAEAEAAAAAEAEAKAAAEAEAAAQAAAEAEAAAAKAEAEAAEAEAAAAAEAEAAAAAEAEAEPEATVEPEAEAEPVEAVAFLMFSDGSYANQYLAVTDEVAFTAANAVVTGPGAYTVGLTFSEPVEGLSFLGVVLPQGETLLPGAIYEITEVKVDGTAIALGKTYTYSKNGVVTRNNIYDEWIGEMPADARMIGDKADYTATAVSTDDFASYQSIEVTFNVIAADAM